MNDAEKCTMMEWFVFSRWSEGSSVQSTGGERLLRLFLHEAFTGIRPLSMDVCTCASTLPLKPRAHSANGRWHFFPEEMSSQTRREGPNQFRPKGVNQLVFMGSPFSEKGRKILLLLKYDWRNKSESFEAFKLMSCPVKLTFIVFSEA